MTYYTSLALRHLAVGGLQSVRKANSACGLPSAPERRECKSRVTLLLRDADSGQIDHMAAEPTHGPHHPCSSSSWLGARGPFLTIAQSFPYGGSRSLFQVTNSRALTLTQKPVPAAVLGHGKLFSHLTHLRAIDRSPGTGMG